MMRIAEYRKCMLPVFNMDKAAIVSFNIWFNDVGGRLLKALPFISGYGLTAVSKQFVLKG